MKTEPFEPTREAREFVRACSQEIDAEDPGVSEWFVQYSHDQEQRLSSDYDMVRDNCEKDSVIVEIASVPLILTVCLKKAGYNVVGVDIEPERFSGVIRDFGLDVRKCDIERQPLPIPDNYCDYVLFNEIFEHLRINPVFSVREVFRILKPGGKLFLSTPNLHSYRGIINFLFKKRAQATAWDIYEQYEKLETLGHMGHVREYTVPEVRAFLRRAGFVIEDVVYRGPYRSKIEFLIVKLKPALRCFFSCIARKPD
jgi:SAM-dependent methyltransferase